MTKSFKIAVLLICIAIAGLVGWLLLHRRVQPVAQTVVLPEAEFNDGQIQYQKNDTLFSVKTQTVKVLDLLSPSALASNSQECGTNLSVSHFSDLLARYNSGSAGTQYHFVYNGPSQGGEYVVTVLPNLLGYADHVPFAEDFNQCFVGGDLYPLELSQHYLMFINSVSTGFDDGSGLPHGGEIIEDSIYRSLRLVEPYDYIQ